MGEFRDKPMDQLRLKRIEIIEIPEKFYFKVSAAATYLGISANSLRKYTDLGLIAAKRLPSGDRLYCKDDLDSFFQSLDDAVHQLPPVGRHAQARIESTQSNPSASPKRKETGNGY